MEGPFSEAQSSKPSEYISCSSRSGQLSSSSSTGDSFPTEAPCSLPGSRVFAEGTILETRTVVAGGRTVRCQYHVMVDGYLVGCTWEGCCCCLPQHGCMFADMGSFIIFEMQMAELVEMGTPDHPPGFPPCRTFDTPDLDNSSDSKPTRCVAHIKPQI
jgi:hypothetical protein